MVTFAVAGRRQTVGYKDPEQRRKYAREWKAARRADWFKGKMCVNCSSAELLELDHIDPKQKVSHKIWSWSVQRREAELAKCQILCRVCHEKTSAAVLPRGEEHGSAILREEDVLMIRASGESRKTLAQRYNVSPETIKTIRARRSWKHV